MRTFIGTTAALLLLAALGSGCTATTTTPATETAHALASRTQEAHEANAEAAALPEAWQRAEDARDIAFFSQRIPGYRTAQFQE